MTNHPNRSQIKIGTIDQQVFRSRVSGQYAVRIEPSKRGRSYWQIIAYADGQRTPSDDGWSYYNDDRFEPVEGVEAVFFSAHGSGKVIVRQIGAPGDFSVG